ncbi:hypothetical protein H0H81_012288 [Sphagnurus paluster]|uniref:CCHC-type domain-containing protein n=1 Tax=Sphagnurus paluster TaxID=117069 RepID=A0A9P7K4S3_9AGAR|nr:hypothetical protein H0H81_012288 [Sphagnurus paluster]
MAAYNLHRRNTTINNGELPVLLNAASALEAEEVGRPPSREAAQRSWSDVVADRSPSPTVRVNTDQRARVRLEVASEEEHYSLAKTSKGDSSESEITSIGADVHDDNPNPWVTDPVLKEAENQLTLQQQAQIRSRYAKLTPRREASVESRGEGPSKSKGKAADPRNWGAAGIDPAELERLKSRSQKQNSADETDQGSKKRDCKKHAKKLRKEARADERDSRTPMSGLMAQHVAHLTKGRSQKKKVAVPVRKPELNPVAQKYDGTADARSYHRSVTEGTAYVRDGKVKSKRQAFVLSYYLKGKAYNFYTQKVSVNSSQWTLQEFYQELFNYCFPINYRLKQREKLWRSFQNDKSVTEYIYELEELYIMIGIIDERERVMKLWHGLRTDIQKALWRERLNPEISSWEEVCEAAQIIEISEGITDSREKRSHPKKNSEDDKRPQNNPSGQARREDQPCGRYNYCERNHNRHDQHSDRSNRQKKSDGDKKPEWKPKLTMSDRERNKLLAAGKCFKCKEAGHVARQCPKGTFVKSDKSGKAPGVPNFSIGIDLDWVEESRQLAATTEELYGVGVGSVSFDLETYPQL